VIVTFVAYILPFSAKDISNFICFDTVYPLVFLLNGLFFLYWAIHFKTDGLISFSAFDGYTFINKLYKLSSTDLKGRKDFTVMSYNVRLFNLFKWLDKEDVQGNLRIYK
jgi:hypothetical protein